jgi:Protein of unknown function (DUF3455)
MDIIKSIRMKFILTTSFAFFIASAILLAHSASADPVSVNLGNPNCLDKGSQNDSLCKMDKGLDGSRDEAARPLPGQVDNARVGPDLPPGCESLEVPSGNIVSFHVYARGVQIYRWDDTTGTWVFVAPSASLYANAGYQGLVGTHYAGPTWESNSGSTVVGHRLQGCSPEPTAIPWLLLEAVTSQGPGPFNGTTYIQRVSTTGGLAPNRQGSPGETVEVPYTAQYYFYRASSSL